MVLEYIVIKFNGGLSGDCTILKIVKICGQLQKKTEDTERGKFSYSSESCNISDKVNFA